MQSRRKQINAAVVVAIVFLSLAQLTCAATVPESVPLGRFVRVQLDEGEKAIVLSQDFAPVDIIAGDKMIAFTGLPGRYVVVVLKGDEQPQQFFTQITGAVPPPKPPEPKPDPTVPPPTGLAGEIYALAKPIGQPEKCRKYSDNYEVISTEIAAGALRTLSDIRARVQQLNEPLLSSPRDPRWVEVGNLIQSKIAATASVDIVKQVFDAAVIGLRAAGGVQ